MITYRPHPNWKYQLVEDAVFETPFRPNFLIDFQAPAITPPRIRLDVDGVLTIGENYSWDGCSGPTIDTKNSMQGGLAHDALYNLMRLKLLARTDFNRKAADDLFRAILLDDGMWAIRANYYHKGARVFGDSSTHPRQDNKYKQRLVAP